MSEPSTKHRRQDAGACYGCGEPQEEGHFALFMGKWAICDDCVMEAYTMVNSVVIKRTMVPPVEIRVENAG